MGEYSIANLSKAASLAAESFRFVALRIRGYEEDVNRAYWDAYDKCKEAANALMEALGEEYKSIAECLQEIQQMVDEWHVDDKTMPPREYGTKLRDRRERFHKHDSYNYIPQARRNLPYMRRNC